MAVFAATSAAAQTEEQQVEAQQTDPEQSIGASDDPPAVGTPESDAIVVTGSRIAQPNFDADHRHTIQMVAILGRQVGFKPRFPYRAGAMLPIKHR